MMLITTQDEFADYTITETLGAVRGNVVRARNVGRDIMAGFRSIVGGENHRIHQIDRRITRTGN